MKTCNCKPEGKPTIMLVSSILLDQEGLDKVMQDGSFCKLGDAEAGAHEFVVSLKPPTKPSKFMEILNNSPKFLLDSSTGRLWINGKAYNTYEDYKNGMEA